MTEERPAPPAGLRWLPVSVTAEKLRFTGGKGGPETVIGVWVAALGFAVLIALNAFGAGGLGALFALGFCGLYAFWLALSEQSGEVIVESGAIRFSGWWQPAVDPFDTVRIRGEAGDPLEILVGDTALRQFAPDTWPPSTVLWLAREVAHRTGTQLDDARTGDWHGWEHDDVVRAELEVAAAVRSSRRAARHAWQVEPQAPRSLVQDFEGLQYVCSGTTLRLSGRKMELGGVVVELEPGLVVGAVAPRVGASRLEWASGGRRRSVLVNCTSATEFAELRWFCEQVRQTVRGVKPREMQTAAEVPAALKKLVRRE